MAIFIREITKEEIQNLEKIARLCRGDIIKMTTIAGSGHPGGSMSSIEIYLTLFSFANISPKNFDDPKRDRIIISHGHTSPGLYACLARLGFIDLKDVLIGFRKISTIYEGHVVQKVPGIEWSTGNLGQGLSAGCGFALASKLGKFNFNTFVAMSDAEQAKGQVSEARRFAFKYNLSNLTVIIDYNHAQISGRTDDVMPVNIKEDYLADGWMVIEVPGHNFGELHQAIRKALSDSEKPYAIICNTVIGHGVSFMENNVEYHGRVLNTEEYQKALAELGIEDDTEKLLSKKDTHKFKKYERKRIPLPVINIGRPKIYSDETHPRNVFGNVLEEIAQNNSKNLIAVFDCDLADSVRVDKFARVSPEKFFECGVSEHNTATIAGALSINGILTIWADFGVFAIDEVYNQLRLNDINNTNLKIIATHLGYNVGPDGKTHHCIDYIGLLRNLFGFKLIIPGDPNQTDHITRYILNQPGNCVVGLTRTKLPIIKTEDDKIFFNEAYKFVYGRIDLIRDGKDCAIFTFGPMLHQAVAATEKLEKFGINARVYNVSSPLNIDKGVIIQAAKTGLIVTYEDHVVTSGIGSLIAQVIAEENLKTRFIKIGITNYGGSDNHDVLYKKYSLDTDSLVQTIREIT
jgi:transketolase